MASKKPQGYEGARCPKCRKRDGLRCHVSLFLEIPMAVMHHITKTTIRRKDVQFQGAGWPTSTLTCLRCGWWESRHVEAKPSPKRGTDP